MRDYRYFLWILLSFLLSWEGAQATPGFFSDSWLPRTAPSLPSGTPDLVDPGAVDLTFSLDFSDTVAPVLPTIFGNNANGYMNGLLGNSVGLDNLRALDMGSMRLPGGNWSNQWLWDGTVHWTFHEGYEASIRSMPTTAWTMTSGEMYAVADSIGTQVQPCVNFSLARYIQGSDSVEQAAHYATDWVRDLNITRGRGVKYWEVGNENYGSWQSGYTVNGEDITGTMYGEGFRIFADSMHAADPSIKIGAVVYEGNSNSWTGDWNAEVIPLVEGYADFLAVHQYFTYSSNMNDVTVQEQIDALNETWKTIELLDSTVGALTSLGVGGIPVAMTEYNVRAGAKDMAHISALFTSMALGEYIRAGYGLVNIWDMANGYDTNDGDHGTLTRNDPDRVDYSPNPHFYSYYYFNKFFGDQQVEVLPRESSGVRVYSSIFSSGEVGVVVVNPTSTAQVVELQLQNFSASGDMQYYSLTASGPESREIFVNGQSESSVSGPLNYADIGPMTRTYSGDPVYAAPAWSANFILLGNVGDPLFKENLPEGILQQKQTGLRLLGPRQNRLALAKAPQQVRTFDLQGRVLDMNWSWADGDLYTNASLRNRVLIIEIR